MATLSAVQIRASLMVVEELQQHTQNPDQYEIYEHHKEKLKEMLELKGHNPAPQSNTLSVLTDSPSGTLAKPLGLVGAFDSVSGP